MFDRDLVRKINSGKCFVLVGSGPSCEVGYPSWDRLANSTYEQLFQKGYVKDKRPYEDYLKEKKYPELFRQAEIDIGNRKVLIDLVKSLLFPAVKQRGIIYEILAKWPFACYLTTNFDDELGLHLSRTDTHFKVLRNRFEDCSSIRHDSSNLIQKLHSDLDHPDEVVLTSLDYQSYYASFKNQYFGEKLKQIFNMFDLFIIGHSLTDPDIEFILRLAKDIASLQHPIYMAAANFNPASEREYIDKYNIKLIPYQAIDGDHARLRRILSVANKFIVPRGDKRMSRMLFTLPPPEEIQAASALFMFRRLQLARSLVNINSLVLVALSDVQKPGLPLDKLLGRPPLNTIPQKSSDVIDSVNVNIHNLVKEGLIDEMSGNYWIIEKGIQRVKEYQAVSDTEKDQAYGQFLADMKTFYGSSLSEEQQSNCLKLAEIAIVHTFDSRGLTIANKVFAGQSAKPGELSDIFGCISEVATNFEDPELRAAFVESMHSFIVLPNDSQKKYLASISQGYFLFHLLGLDPNCVKLRQDIFTGTLWFCDSSVLLPLLAVGCHNYDYALSLFSMLKKSRAVLCTTPKLLQEAWEHLEWAVNFVKHHKETSPEFIQAVLVKGSYTQNLFLDGYIRLNAEGRIGGFGEYIALICLKGLNYSSFELNVKQYGIQILSQAILSGLVTTAKKEIEVEKDSIKLEREKLGTYRSELQIESEAEVSILIKYLSAGKFSIADLSDKIEKFYFISISRILDKLSQPELVMTWMPEDVYRYLSALPEEQLDPNLLQQCMLHEYFNKGVAFIDKERYLRFFGPSIDAAMLSYEAEKDKYIAAVEKTHIKELDEMFERTPDLEKPFFVTQMAWRVAEVAQLATESEKIRAEEAEAKVKRLESEKMQAWKIRSKKIKEQEAARLRNLRDPKHARKRAKQAKKRRKKK